jgi:plasmid stabilization system protein ParE
MYSVLFTRTAEADLEEILDYLSRVLDNRPAAGNFLDELDKRIQKVSDYPEAHPLVADDHLRERGIRMFAIGNYLAIYRIHLNEQTAVILRLLHCRRDWISLLMEDGSM